ncbi:MAG: hypothetical protein IJZ85_06775 [Lachnospiraceae bacterium]|nr:hypothetical protein [Lachnospiraceae bacterium]
MAQVIYTKYNKLRRKEFRVQTSIYEENGRRFVVKRAVCPESEPHVDRMLDRKLRLKAIYRDMDFVDAEKTEDGVRFEYLAGESVDGVLACNPGEERDLKQTFGAILHRVLPDEEVCEPFKMTPEFKTVFGDVKGLEGRAAAPLANIDCILENIIMNGEYLTCLDYEWVFDFPVPIDFMRYRVVHYFYKAHPEVERIVSEREMLDSFSLSEFECALFEAMESAFQHYVFGGEQDCRYTENYRQPVTTYDQMIAEKQRNLHEIDELRKVVGHYEGVERKLRKIGLWQALQGAQKVGRKVKGVIAGER